MTTHEAALFGAYALLIAAYKRQDWNAALMYKREVQRLQDVLKAAEGRRPSVF